MSALFRGCGRDRLAAVALTWWMLGGAGGTLEARDSNFTPSVNEQVAAARRIAPQIGIEIYDLAAQETVYSYNHNTQRILRALEVLELTGRPISAHWEAASTDSALDGFECLRHALVPAERAALHEAIDRRLDAMFAAGFEAEVRALHARGDLHEALPAIRAVGYRQLWAYLEGEIDLEQARRRAAAATRQLARRQLTWLRSWPRYTQHEVALPAPSLEVIADGIAADLDRLRALAGGRP